MCLNKRSFDIIYKRSSKKGKKLKRRADKFLARMTYFSSDNKLQKYLKLREEYLKFVYGDSVNAFISSLGQGS